MVWNGDEQETFDRARGSSHEGEVADIIAYLRTDEQGMAEVGELTKGIDPDGPLAHQHAVAMEKAISEAVHVANNISEEDLKDGKFPPLNVSPPYDQIAQRAMELQAERRKGAGEIAEVALAGGLFSSGHAKEEMAGLLAFPLAVVTGQAFQQEREEPSNTFAGLQMLSMADDHGYSAPALTPEVVREAPAVGQQQGLYRELKK